MRLASVDPQFGDLLGCGTASILAVASLIVGVVAWRGRHRAHSVSGRRDPASRRPLSGRLWCWPLLFGLPAAFIIGVRQSLLEIDQQAMFRFHFYHTAFGLLAGAMNRWAPYTVGFIMSFVLAVWLSRRVSGVAGAVLRVILPLAVVGAMAWYFLPRYLSRLLLCWAQCQSLVQMAVHGKTLTGIIGQTLPHPVTLGGILILLVIIEMTIVARRRRQQRQDIANVTPHQRRLFGLLRVCAGFVDGILLLLVFGYAASNLAAGYWHVQAARAPRGRPNIIFIMIDTLRADHVGCYGYDLPTTPNIDRFARASTRIEHAVAQSSWTVWSVTSLMSSRYPERLFASGWSSRDFISDLGIGKYYPVLAEMLRDRGYSTNAVIGNPWLINTPTNAQGYDYYHDGAARIMQARDTAPLITDTALRRLGKIGKRPFFLYAVYMDPHEPYFQHRNYVFGGSKRDRAIREVIAAGNTPQKLTKREKNQQRKSSGEL